MFEIAYNNNIPYKYHHFFVVADSGNIYEVHAGVPDRPGRIIVPEPASRAVVLRSCGRGFERFASLYLLPHGFHLGDFAHLFWPAFEDWVKYGRVPRANLVCFQEEAEAKKEEV